MGKNQDPGSGINIPDPQHCLSEKIYFKFDYDSELPVSEIAFGIERKCLTWIVGFISRTQRDASCNSPTLSCRSAGSRGISRTTLASSGRPRTTWCRKYPLASCEQYRSCSIACSSEGRCRSQVRCRSEVRCRRDGRCRSEVRFCGNVRTYRYWSRRRKSFRTPFRTEICVYLNIKKLSFSLQKKLVVPEHTWIGTVLNWKTHNI